MFGAPLRHDRASEQMSMLAIVSVPTSKVTLDKLYNTGMDLLLESGKGTVLQHPQQ